MSQIKTSSIELNGIANMQLLVDNIKWQNGAEKQITIHYIREQLDRLERYLVAYNKAIQDETQPPQWYEVRDNPQLYPLNKEV